MLYRPDWDAGLVAKQENYRQASVELALVKLGEGRILRKFERLGFEAF